VASTTRTDAPAQAPETEPKEPEKVSRRERVGYVLRHSKLWLVALILLAIAAAVAAGSLAVFTSSSANPNNEVSSGILAQSNSSADSGTAILTAQNMFPGDTATGTVTIKNTGTVAGTFTLSDSNLVDVPGTNGGNLSSVLLLTVRDNTTGTDVYNGGFNAVPTPPTPPPLVALPGSSGPKWAVNETHNFTFTVRFPDSGQPPSATTGDNAYQGSKVTVTYNWNAIA
jgi:hypothetical protein